MCYQIAPDTGSIGYQIVAGIRDVSYQISDSIKIVSGIRYRWYQISDSIRYQIQVVSDNIRDR